MTEFTHARRSATHSLRLSALCGASILGLGLIAWGAGAALLAPPLGVTLFSGLRDPRGDANAPLVIVAAHAVGILAGLVALWSCEVLGLGPSEAGEASLFHALSSSVAVAMTAMITVAGRITHPPALATTLVVSLQLLPGQEDLLALQLGACLVAGAMWWVRRLP